MEQRTFHIQEALSVGWKKTGEHFWFLVGLGALNIGYIIVIAVIDVSIKIAFKVSDAQATINLVNVIIPLIVGPMITCGTLRICYDLYTNNTSSYKQLFYSIQYIFRSMVAAFYGALLLIAVAIQSALATYVTYLICRAVVTTEFLGIGSVVAVSTVFALSFVPLFFLLLTSFEFSPLAVVSDDTSSAWAALRFSIKITKGYRLKLLLFTMLSVFLWAISLGLLWSVISIAWVHVYFRLKGLHGL